MYFNSNDIIKHFCVKISCVLKIILIEIKIKLLYIISKQNQKIVGKVSAATNRLLLKKEKCNGWMKLTVSIT